MAWIIAALFLAAIGYAVYRTRGSWLADQSAPQLGDNSPEDKASMKADRTDPQ